MNPPTNSPAATSRRDFITKTAGATAATVASTGLTVAQSANVAGSDRVKIGLIGSGGRGSGAADQALTTPNANFVLHAVCDAFKEKAEGSLSNIRNKHAERVQVEDRIYDGVEGYKKVIDSCDLVILTTPPGFRPYHFEAAINAGKNVFMEKPVAVDSPGVRKVLEMAKVADEKKLKVVVGLQRRYQNCYIDALKQVKEQGIIGDMNDLQYQLNNWYHFTWLCGDHINEQHIHNIDVANWFIGGHPEKAAGMGGRQQRVDKKWGQIYDHHYVEFTYANGVRVNSQCRHQSNTKPDVREEFTGTKGKLYLDNSGKCYAVDHKGNTIWKYRPARGGDAGAEGKGKKNKGGTAGDPNPYQVEHDTLQDAIINNKPINNAYYGAESTMTAVLGRMATYSGQEITWDQALNSKVQHMPAIITAESQPPVKPNAEGWYPIAIPGQKVEGVEVF
jgi:predicted dehydrogenase